MANAGLVSADASLRRVLSSLVISKLGLEERKDQENGLSGVRH
jgi:hypothetical protein